jgi:hypothetical protein
MFNLVDVRRILQIPLNVGAFKDYISWHGNKNGVFSVGSAYHIEWKHQYNGRTCRELVQGTSLNNPIWRILWKLAGPANVNFFGWRAMHGILPLKSILANRHVGTSGQCPLCCGQRMSCI